MKDDVDITPVMTNLFISGIQRNDFSEIGALVEDKRTDSFSIYFTHDIDWLNPFHPYSLVKYAYSLVRHGSIWHSWATLRQKNSLLRNIEDLIRFEQKLGIPSIFLAGASAHHLGRYGIRYSIHDGLFKELVSILNSNKIVIGLHSSYNACSQNMIASEKQALESMCGQKISVHRSHFLHYEPDSLYTQLEQAGISLDMGLGEARAIGFANRFPGKFKPVNIPEQRGYNVTCVPLMLMDNIFFFLPYADVMQQFRDALRMLKRFNGSACILFHPENMLLKSELWHYYEEIVDICRQEGANINPHLNRL